MTLLKIDGFDSYNSDADVDTRWTSYTGVPGMFYDTVGRMGVGKCLRTDNTFYTLQTPVPNLTQVIAGFAVYFTSPPGQCCLCQLLESGSTHTALSMVAGGQLTANRGINTVLATSINAIAINTWYYIEVMMKVSDSLGANEWICKVNGEEWINVPATSDSRNGLTGVADQFSLSANYGNIPRNWDDFYLLDPNSGTAPQNTFLGDCRVDSLRLDGNGTTSDFVGSDADSVDNYLLVDEVDPDGDTTYIESSTPAEIDLHTIESLPVTPDTIYGVNAVSIARKTDAGARTGKHIVRTGATNYEGAEFFPGTPQYGGFENIWEENPNTVSAWVEADITGLETGIKVES